MTTIDSIQLTHRLGQLGDDLGRFDANLPCPWQIAKMFNALLDQAKEEKTQDAVVATIQPLTQRSYHEGYAEESCGVVKAYVSQLQAALGEV